MTSPTKIADFTILPMSIPPVPSYPHKATHYMYIRPHEPKIPDSDTPRSLFVVNLPIDATQDSLRKLFADQLGGARVAKVDFEDEKKRSIGAVAGFVPYAQSEEDKDGRDGEGDGRGKKRKRGVEEADIEAMKLPQTWDREVLRGGSCATVVFVDRHSAGMALRECNRVAKGAREVVWKYGEGLGVERYKTHHALTYPSKHALQASVDAYLTAFAAHEQRVSRQRTKARSVPDADGFVTMTRGGRTAPASIQAAQAAAEKAKERDKNRIGGDFYKFQVREKRKERERELKRQFEQDRRKVEDMRRAKGRVRPE